MNKSPSHYDKSDLKPGKTCTDLVQNQRTAHTHFVDTVKSKTATASKEIVVTLTTFNKDGCNRIQSNR